jgi:multiple antibiotic resistance protein
MVFPPPKEEQQALSKEPFIVPMAIPLVAGPAVLAGVMIYARQASSEWLLIGGVTLAWLVSTVILLAASFLKRVLGERGLFACERLMGLLLVLIAVQMFLNGIALYCAPSL